MVSYILDLIDFTLIVDIFILTPGRQATCRPVETIFIGFGFDIPCLKYLKERCAFLPLITIQIHS